MIHDKSKYQIKLGNIFQKKALEGDIEQLFYTVSKMKTLMYLDGLENIISSVLENSVKKIDGFIQRGSGWTYYHTISIQISVLTYNPIRVGNFIPLPDWIAKKNACVNIQNKDKKCFQ